MYCYNVSTHGFYFAIVFSHIFFFFKIIFVKLFFFNIKLVENLDLTFPTCFFFMFVFAFFVSKIIFFFFSFFCVFFSELFLSILFF